jgi:hypothetical protein
MNKKFVRVVCDLHCKWEGLAPIYRLYVNDELFTERTWIWRDNVYLQEQIQIEAEPGDYAIRYELVPPNLAELTVTNSVVKNGPGEIIKPGQLRIHDETA